MNENSQTGRTDRTAPVLIPRVDIFEDDTGLTLLADMPGVSRENFGLKVEGDTLTLEGDIAPATPADLKPVHAEVQVARYRRAFTLSRELDSDAIQAESRDGVLRLRIPKRESAQPRRITVQVA